MKKILFIIALLGSAIITFAKPVAKETKVVDAVATIHDDTKSALGVIHDDVKDVTKTLYGDSKDVIVTLYPEVKSAVIEIAKAIGCAAEHVYTVLVKKFVVDAIVETIPFIFGLVLLILGWVKLSQYLKNNKAIDWHILYPISLLIVSICLFCSVNYNTMVMGLVNPEYGALNYILEYSKEMIK